MARNNRMHRISTEVPTCTLDQKNELWIGPTGDGESAFRNERERRQMGKTMADELLNMCPPMRRPWSWHQYFAPPRLWGVSDQHAQAEDMENFLERIGQLRPAEQVLLDRLRNEGLIPEKCITEVPPAGFQYRKPSKGKP